MSCLDYAVPVASNFAPQSSDFGSFWGSGPPDFQLSSTTTALEAQALSSLFVLDATDLFQHQDQAEGGQSRRAEGGRKRKMSNREDYSREQQPKRRRETEPFHRPQYVAPHELTTSPADMPSFPPLPTPREGVRRQASAGPAFDQRRPVEPPATYSQSQYLQAPDTDWSRSTHRPERPVLPSISSTPGYTGSPQLSSRPPTSYSVPSIPSGYAPVMSQPQYDRHGSYSYAPAEFEHRSSQSGMTSQGPLPSASEASQLDAEGRPNKPQCWEHGCNGKQFSTYSNFLRHQRERDGTSAKSYCPRCGAEFTRSTARNGHLLHAKCKPRRSPDPSASQSSQQ